MLISMEINQQDNSVLTHTCVEAFKQGDHDVALRLLPSLQQHATVRSVYYIVPAYECTNVSLLHLAALHGWMDIVASLVCEYNCSSQCCDSRGQTPLHYAAHGGSLPVVQYLITEQHCDPLQCNNYNGGTPFLYACGAGHPEIVKYLITKCKCDPASSNNGESDLPIHTACYSGQMKVVKYLITNKYCTPDCKGKFGWTPLHNACYNGHMKVVKYFIKKRGCDPVSPDNDGDLPIHIACLGGQLSVVKYLITNKYCSPNCKGRLDWTLLHIACNEGHMEIIKYLTTESGCDPAIPDSNGDLPIHVACLGGQLDVVKYLIINQYSSPNCKGKWGYTPLHYACDKGHINIIQYLIRDSGCTLTSADCSGNMAIHTACVAGQLKVVKYLISNHYFSPNCAGSREQTPLNVAFHSDHMEIVQFLISNIDNLPDINIELLGKWLNILKYLISIQYPNSKQCGQRLLHSACEVGSVESVRYLTYEVDCDLSSPDNDGNFPIHVACLGGHLNVVECLSQKCNPNCKGKGGRTLLHFACVDGHMNIIQYLITKQGCDPTVLDDEGSTPLHLASNMGHIEIVRWLLRDSRVNVLSKDKSGCTPMDSAELAVNNYESLEVFQLFRPLIQSMKEYPIHLCTKVVLTGNSGAGKTTLSQAFVSSRWFHQFKEQPPVEQLTAGIISHHVLNQHIILYDLAGHAEFYFSQSTVMEVVVRNSRAIFVNLVDLSTNDMQITDSVYYWLNFIEDTTSRSDKKSFLLIVGSHADLINESQLEEKKQLVNELVAARKKLRLEYAGLVSMDCRNFDSEFDSEVFKQFFAYVAKCRHSILAEAPSLSIYCHALYAFLQTKIDKVACQLQALVSLLTSEGSVVPAELIFVSELLESLNNKGVIVYLKNKQCLEKSCVVVKKEVILKYVNEALFSPEFFKEHRKIASSTGIIRLSSFHEVFHKYDLDMLVELLVSLEFCVLVNLSGVKTNLQAIMSTTQPDDTSYLFFPALLRVDKPQSDTEDIQQSCAQNFRFGWCLGGKDYAYQYFTFRFIYILLLRLAYTFPLPCESISQTHALHGLERKCTVWKNGISWNNDDGIRTVVEVIQHRWVVVTMFHNKDTRPVEYSRHRSAVIRLVLDLQQELASDLETIECLISPTLLQQWPLEQLVNADLFAIKDVARSAFLHKPIILSCKDDQHHLATSDALFFEPYHLLSPSSVCELMDSSKNDQPVSPALLSEARKCCQLPQLESQSYSSLREHLDKMSIFAGRNPLVVAELDADTVIELTSAAPLPPPQPPPSPPSSSPPLLQPQSLKEPVPTVNLSGIPDSILDDSHLRYLMTALRNIICQWKNLGLQLGLGYHSELKVIEKNERDVRDCMMEMLAAWLKGQGDECSKQTLKTALQKIDCKIIAE